MRLKRKNLCVVLKRLFDKSLNLSLKKFIKGAIFLDEKLKNSRKLNPTFGTEF